MNYLNIFTENLNSIVILMEFVFLILQFSINSYYKNLCLYLHGIHHETMIIFYYFHFEFAYSMRQHGCYTKINIYQQFHVKAFLQNYCEEPKMTTLPYLDFRLMSFQKKY